MASERRNKSEAEWRPPPPFPKQHQHGPRLESKLAGVSVGLCPIDLAVCERVGCCRDVCERADASPLLVCWECGAVESETLTAGTCVSCLRIYVPDPMTEVI